MDLREPKFEPRSLAVVPYVDEEVARQRSRDAVKSKSSMNDSASHKSIHVKYESKISANRSSQMAAIFKSRSASNGRLEESKNS